MASMNEPVGSGCTATGPIGASTPFQQLGAAPGTSEGVPGYEGSELEEDGLEFASSGEAADASRLG